MTILRPTISIVVPVYNLEDYLEDCILSILNQSTNNLELILVNDGSSDRSRELCDAYADHPSVIVIHQKNQGVSAARNNGLKKASGEYIYFVDGDDMLADGSIKAIMDKILITDADIISGTYVKFTNPNDISLGTKISSDVVRAIELRTGHDAVKELIQRSIFLPNVSTNIVKRDLFDNSGIQFSLGVSNTEDLHCGMQLYLNANKIAVLEEPIYYYRQARQGSLSSTFTKKSVGDLIAFIDEWVQRINHFEDNDAVKVWLLDYMAYQYLIALGLTHLCSEGDRAALIPRLKTSQKLLESGLSKRTRYASLFMRMFGLEATGRALSYFIRIKALNLQLVAQLFNLKFPERRNAS